MSGLQVCYRDARLAVARPWFAHPHSGVRIEVLAPPDAQFERALALFGQAGETADSAIAGTGPIDD